MDMRSLISVIVPVYKTEQYLPKCIESILAQTYTNLEVILVDDESPDRCGEICDTYAKQDARIRVIHHAHGGVSAARNAGLDLATGDYLGFADSDDWLEPAMFEQMLAPFMQDAELDVSVCGWYRHEAGEIISKGGTLHAGTMTGCEALRCANRGESFDGYLWNKLFRAGLLQQRIESKPIYRLRNDIYICEDLLVCSQFFYHCRKVYYNSAPLYHYVIRENSALKAFDVRRETEFTARRAIMQLTEGSRELHSVAAYAYAQSSLNYAIRAKSAGLAEVYQRMHRQARKYVFPILLGAGVGAKAKIRFLTMCIAPMGSRWIWNCCKTWFHWSWIREGDK